MTLPQIIRWQMYSGGPQFHFIVAPASPYAGILFGLLGSLRRRLHGTGTNIQIGSGGATG
jgi:hypothetical protein